MSNRKKEWIGVLWRIENFINSHITTGRCHPDFIRSAKYSLKKVLENNL